MKKAWSSNRIRKVYDHIFICTWEAGKENRKEGKAINF